MENNLANVAQVRTEMADLMERMEALDGRMLRASVEGGSVAENQAAAAFVDACISLLRRHGSTLNQSLLDTEMIELLEWHLHNHPDVNFQVPDEVQAAVLADESGEVLRPAIGKLAEMMLASGEG